jgi:hypothetical protein
MSFSKTFIKTAAENRAQIFLRRKSRPGTWGQRAGFVGSVYSAADAASKGESGADAITKGVTGGLAAGAAGYTAGRMKNRSEALGQKMKILKKRHSKGFMSQFRRGR